MLWESIATSGGFWALLIETMNLKGIPYLDVYDMNRDHILEPKP